MKNKYPSILIDRKSFLNKYNISINDFQYVELKWKSLSEIYKEYVIAIENENIEKFISIHANDILLNCPNVHSIRYRVKNPEHLISKIIRDKIANVQNIDINLQNYNILVEDILGIRLLHIFKEDWSHIYKYIDLHYNKYYEPYASYRKGDNEAYISELSSLNIKSVEDNNGYRSIHFFSNISCKTKTFPCELQIRSLFEEAWSEIGHAIWYPSNLNDPILNKYFKIYNRISGALDEMGSFIRQLHDVSRKTEEKVNKSHILINNIEQNLYDVKLPNQALSEIRSTLQTLRVIEPDYSEKPQAHLRDRNEYYNKAISCLQQTENSFRQVTEGPFLFHPEWLVHLRNKKYKGTMPNFDVEIASFINNNINSDKMNIKIIIRNSQRYISKINDYIKPKDRSKYKMDMIKNIQEIFSLNINNNLQILCLKTGFISYSEIFTNCILKSDKNKEAIPFKEGWLYTSQLLIDQKKREFDDLFNKYYKGNESEIKTLINFINNLWS